MLVTFERDVIPPGHPCLRSAGGKRPTREGRHSYLLPNGSEFIVQGAADIEGLKSQEYDVIYWNEITECPTHEPFEALHRALRSGPVPNRQLIADCNPKLPTHWILKRCARGLCRRIITRMEDNPRYYDAEKRQWTPDGLDYRNGLGRNLTGLQYKRLFLGEWCAAEGAFFPEFTEHEEFFRPAPPPYLVNAAGETTGKRNWGKLDIRWWAAGVDWGTKSPGVMQVWGFDGEQRAYRVAEIYRTRMSKDWWAKRAVEFIAEFHSNRTPFMAIIADAHEDGTIETFNDRIRDAGFPTVCRPAKHDFAENADIVRDAFVNKRIRLLLDSQRYGREQELDESAKPCNTEEELLELVYPDHVDKPHRAKDEQWDQQLCADHGVDAMLYVLGWAWRKDFVRATAVPKFVPGSAGHILGHEKKLARARKRA